jgi:outer membrane protein
MRNKQIIVLCLSAVFFLFAHQAISQDKILSLEECIEIALDNNSVLRNAERQVDYSNANVVSARSSFLPRVNSSFSSGKYIQGPRQVKTDVPVGIDPETGGYLYEQQTIKQSSTNRNYNSASVSLSQNIWDFGRSSNALKSANASQEATVQSMLNTRQAVVLDVKDAYFQLLKAQELLQVYEEGVALAEEQVERVKTMMDIGLTSKAEVFTARVTLGGNKRQAIEQKNSVEMLRANLNTSLGIDPGTPIEIQQVSEEPTFLAYDFDQAVETAFANNPEIKSLDLSVKASLYNLRAAKARYMPSIGASASYQRSNDDLGRVYTTTLDEDYTVSMGVGMDLNIFNGFADKAEVQRQTLKYEMDMEDLANQKRLLVSSVKQYFLALQAFEEILEILDENIEAATENLRLQQEKRRVGSGTELEVTTAQVELTRAQSDYVNTEYDAHSAKAYLQAAMGVIE